MIQTTKNAEIEKNVLDELSQIANSKGTLDAIYTRAAKSSLQVIIENAIGKAKQRLKHFDCPLAVTKGKEAFWILSEVGFIEDEFRNRIGYAIGFRDIMIHDYMNFDEKLLLNIVKNQEYNTILTFLIDDVNPSETIKKRIASFSY